MVRAAAVEPSMRRAIGLGYRTAKLVDDFATIIRETGIEEPTFADYREWAMARGDSERSAYRRQEEWERLFAEWYPTPVIYAQHVNAARRGQPSAGQLQELFTLPGV